MLSLESVEATSEQTLITLTVEDADPHNGPPLSRYEGHILPPRDLELDGLSLAEGNYAGSTTAIDNEAGDAIVAYRHEIPLAPVAPEAEEVGVTVKTLYFEAEDVTDPPVVIEGNWEFAFDISDLPVSDFSTLDVSETQRIGDVTFSLDSIELGAEETLVHFAFASDAPGFLERTTFVAQMPDGRFVVPVRVENKSNRHIAHFEPPLPEGETITFVMPQVLLETKEQISFTFPVSGPLDGEQVVDHAATIAGEAMRVVSVTNELSDEAVPQPASEGPEFLVRIENVVPGEAGRVLPGMPLVEQGVRATDNLGNEYTGSRSSTNLEKSDLATSWAGGSSFDFEGTLPTDATELTVSPDSYAQLVGPFSISVELPELAAS